MKAAKPADGSESRAALPQQQRNTRTRPRVRQAFIEALRERGLDGMTVSDLCRRAGINRGTFYLHYVDKFDLLDKLEGEVIEHINELLFQNFEEEFTLSDPIPYPAILRALIYVRDDFDFVAAVAGKGGDPTFSQKMRDLLEQVVQTVVARSDGRLHLQLAGLPDVYGYALLLGGVMSIIQLWIERGAVESPEEIAQVISCARTAAPVDLIQ